MKVCVTVQPTVLSLDEVFHMKSVAAVVIFALLDFRLLLRFLCTYIYVYTLYTYTLHIHVFSLFWICISVVFEQCFEGRWRCRVNWPSDQGAAYFPINASRIMRTMCTPYTYFPISSTHTLCTVHTLLFPNQCCAFVDTPQSEHFRFFSCVVSLAQHFVHIVHIPLSLRVPLPQYKIGYNRWSAQSQYLEHCLRIFYTENWSVDQRRAYFASAITAYFVGCPACDRCAYKQT